MFLYIMSAFARPDCIIMRRRTVSNGYDRIPDVMVTTCCDKIKKIMDQFDAVLSTTSEDFLRLE